MTPRRLLAFAVRALPERRRPWGEAMLAELAAVQGGPARWRFALSSLRAMAGLPSARTWAALAVVVLAAVAVGPLVPSALSVFAATFVGVGGALVVLAVARSRRPRLSVPGLLVAASVVAALAATVYFVRREPSASLSPPAAGYLAAVLAGCLWVASTSAPPRLAARLGSAAAVVFAAWFLLTNRADGAEPPTAVAAVLGLVLVGVPAAAFVLPAYAAARAGGSWRAGRPAAVWMLAAMVPLTFAIWLPEALRRHAVDGRSLDGEVVAPAATALTDALTFCLGVFPVLGLLLGAVGAAFGGRRAVR